MPDTNDTVGTGQGTTVWGGTLSDHRSRQSEHIAMAALGILASDGFSGLTMSAIADAAGVSRQTLYKYFADIDAVLLGLAQMARAMDADLEERISSEADPVDGLRLFISTVLGAAASGHPSPTLMMSALPSSARAALRDHESRAELLVIELLRRGRVSGAFRDDLDPEVDGQIVYRVVLGMHDLAARDSVDAQRLEAHVAEGILRMLASPAAPGRKRPRR